MRCFSCRRKLLSKFFTVWSGLSTTSAGRARQTSGLVFSGEGERHNYCAPEQEQEQQGPEECCPAQWASLLAAAEIYGTPNKCSLSQIYMGVLLPGKRVPQTPANEGGTPRSRLRAQGALDWTGFHSLSILESWRPGVSAGASLTSLCNSRAPRRSREEGLQDPTNQRTNQPACNTRVTNHQIIH